MTEPGLTESAVPGDLLLALYDLAARPSGLKQFMPLWEAWAETQRRAESGPAAWPLRHLALTLELMDRVTPPRQGGPDGQILDLYPGIAAYLSDGGPRIARANRAAAEIFGLSPGAELARLPLDAPDLARLRQLTRFVAEGRMEGPLSLRLRHQLTGGELLLRITAAPEQSFPPLALVVTSELNWPEEFDQSLRAAYGLSPAELDITRALCRGQSVREVAETRGRSTETVRTQLRTILSKTETHSQSDLVRVALTLLQAAPLPGQAPPQPVDRTTWSQVTRIEPTVLRLPQGRRMEYLEFGTPAGRPVVYLHSDWGLARWPAAAERAARSRGLRVLVPFRPGYGMSSPPPAGAALTEATATDLTGLLDHLALREVSFLTLGGDLRFALRLAERRPDLLRSLLAVSPLTPLTTPGDWQALNGWPRWLRANALHCPALLPVITRAARASDPPQAMPGLFEAVFGAELPAAGSRTGRELRSALQAGLLQTLAQPDGTGAATLAQNLAEAELPWPQLRLPAKLRLRLLRGARDPLVPQPSGLILPAERISQSVLPDAGHLLFFSHWHRVLQELDLMLAATE